jgi:hypothetical protein
MTEPPTELIPRKGWRSPWWKKPLTWSVLLTAGFLVYELTADPILGVVLVCSKFGWQDFLLAYRLWRIDPNRPRMLAMSSIYLASGLTKTGLAAGAIFCGASFICGIDAIFWGPQPGQAPWQGAQFGQGLLGRIASALVTSVVVFLLAAVATGSGFWHANRFAIKVWLGPPIVRRAPQGSAWPQEYPTTNAAWMLLRLGLIPLWLGILEWFVAVLAIFNGQLPLPCFIGLGVAPVPIAVVLSTVCYRAQRRGAIATTPAECWGTDLVGAIMCMKVSLAERSQWLASVPREHWRSKELEGVSLQTAGRASNAVRTPGP